MRRALVIVVIAAVGTFWLTARDRPPTPDERIVAHTRALCGIAEDGIAAPRDGVARLFRYHGDHGPAMARDWAELLVLIERIDDDRAHDRRAREAARRIHAPMRRCEPIFERFARAVEGDPAASALLERGMTRLGRTLEILFGKRPHSPAEWPSMLEKQLLGLTAP